jgi:hypothetical protein
MTNRKMLLAGMAVLAASLSGSGLVQAGTLSVSPYLSNSETSVSIGLQYDFADQQLDLIAGARNTKTDEENDVTGAKLDVAIPLTSDNHMPTIRVMGLVGSPDVYGEAGLGYDFAKSQALIGAGAQGPYVNGGFNYYFGSIIAPYIGLNNLDGAPDREIRPPG